MSGLVNSFYIHHRFVHMNIICRYGCRVQFTACSDQSDSRDDQIVMYKAIAAEIIDGPKLSNGDNEQFGLAEQILRDLPYVSD